jgi:zinc transport system substrate-binding protein
VRRFPLSPSWPAFLLLLTLTTAACSGADKPADEQAAAGDHPAPVLHAVASLPPLAWLVEQVGDGRVAVTVLLPPGSSPHTFEPSPRQLAAFDDADLFVAVGHRQVERLLRQRPDLAVVRLMATGDAGDPGTDPHLWLDPRRMEAAAQRLAATLIRLDPQGADLYRAHLAALRTDLASLDRRLAERLGAAPRRRFFVQHPAWGHLAAAYGLEQVALEHEGKETSPKLLVQRIEESRAAGATAIFVERGAAQRAARVFAAETGAEIVVLDPLAADWPAEMERTADALARALGAADSRQETRP